MTEVAKALGVSVARASVMLRRLVEEGVLIRTKRQGGLIFSEGGYKCALL